MGLGGGMAAVAILAAACANLDGLSGGSGDAGLPVDSGSVFDIAQLNGVLPANGRGAVRVKFTAQDFTDHVAVVEMVPVPCSGTKDAATVCKPLPTLPVHGQRTQ